MAQPLPSLATQGAMPPSSANSQMAASETPVSLPGSSPPLPGPDYSGVGNARSVQEAANRTDGNQDVFLFYDSATQTPGTDSASVVLPPGWTGYRLDYSLYDLYENREPGL